MKILLTGATLGEIKPTLDFLKTEHKQISLSEFEIYGNKIYPLISGVGSAMMAFALARYPDIKNMDLVVHAGISGSYNTKIDLLDVIEVITEQWADLGAEDSDGKLLSAFDLGFITADKFPYQDGRLCKKHNTKPTGLKQLHGLTINKSSGTQHTVDQLLYKFTADVESMEGAGLFYAALMMDLPFLSVRAISNHCGPRDKSQWKIEESIAQLNKFIIRYLSELTC